MTDQAEFEAALRTAPDEATGWLAYADWLDDRDDPLAAGVRAVVACRPTVFDSTHNWHRDGDFTGWVLWKYGSFDGTPLRQAREAQVWWDAAEMWRPYDIRTRDARVRGNHVGKRYAHKADALLALARAFPALDPAVRDAIAAAIRRKEFAGV